MELATTQLALKDKKTELDDALAYKTEELNDSQEINDEQQGGIDSLKKKNDTLKDMIYKYQVDLSAAELMIMFVEKEQDIDVDELWNRTIAHIADKHHSVEETVAAAVKQYA